QALGDKVVDREGGHGGSKNRLTGRSVLWYGVHGGPASDFRPAEKGAALEDGRRIDVTAPTGVRIVGMATGSGPGLAFVYGAMMEQAAWSRLLAHLDGYTLYTYDRRGRGESTDAPDFSVQAEVDELRAFLDALGGPVDLFGHSSGALLALDAAVQGA